MTDREKAAQRLLRVRKELDEASEQIGRLAKALTEPVPERVELLGATEIGKLAGASASTVGVWVSRGLLPAPVATLACGRIWLKADIDVWLKARKAKTRATNGRRKA